MRAEGRMRQLAADAETVLLDGADEIERLRRMRVRLQGILGHTVPRELSAELADMWAAAIRELDGGGA